MEPAPIRCRNPGAMWGRIGPRPSDEKEVATNNPLAVKWGSTRTVYLSDGLKQNNNAAIFPTYVQGICAQFDLWRGKRYHNKRLADALAVWSGGNHVESYIRFVCDRVPGMTADTIIDDAFLRGPKGVAFMKAQAWHESGKRYPAPDADFVEAQRRVFGGKVEESPPVTPPPPDVEPEPSPKPKPEQPDVEPAPETPNVPWYKRAWTWVAGSLFGGGLTVGGITLDANTLLALTLLIVVVAALAAGYFVGRSKKWWP